MKKETKSLVQVKHDIKINLFVPPITFEFGYNMFETGDSCFNHFKMADQIRAIARKIEKKENVIIPSILYMENQKLSKEQIVIKIYNVIVSEIALKVTTVDKQEKVCQCMKKIFIDYLYVFKDQSAENEIEKLKKENTHDACTVIYNYYHNVQHDKKASFHWLKKLCYFEIPRDLRRLESAYENGDGCEVNCKLAKKVSRKIRPKEKYERRKRKF